MGTSIRKPFSVGPLRHNQSLPYASPVIVLLLAILCSCGSDKTTQPNDIIFPIHQDEPAWSRGDSLLYLDKGIVCVTTEGAYMTDNSKAGLWVMNVTTMTRTRILPDGRAPAWSPHGDSIVFTLNGQIAVSSASSPSPVLITSGGRNYFPRWSPTSGTIAFDSDFQSPTGANAIWLVQTDGSNLRKVADSTGGADGELRMPDWSPDGKRLLHIRYPGQTNGTSEIYVMNADGTNAVRLTSNMSDDYTPRFSPDGTRVAFSRLGTRGVPQIWVMRADGSGATQLTTDGGSWPTWSPDGNQIAYVQEDWSNKQAGQIWKLVLAGGRQQLTTKWPSQCPSQPK